MTIGSCIRKSMPRAKKVPPQQEEKPSLVQKGDVYVYIRLQIQQCATPPKAYYSWTDEQRKEWMDACMVAISRTNALEALCKELLTEVAEEFRQFEQTFLEKTDPEELKRIREWETTPYRGTVPRYRSK